MHYVYVIRNQEGNMYIGYKRDLEKRLISHNNDQIKTTKGHKWEYVYYEAYRSEKDARTREKSLKRSGQGRRWLKERIINSINS